MVYSPSVVYTLLWSPPLNGLYTKYGFTADASTSRRPESLFPRWQPAGLLFVFLLPLFCRTAQDISRLTQQIAALIRGNTRWPDRQSDVLGNAGRSLGIRQSGARNVDLDDSAVYLHFFDMALKIAVFQMRFFIYLSPLHVIR